MQSKESRALQSYRRVEAWFAGHPDVIPGSGSSAAALTSQVAALKVVVDRMTSQATEQITQAGQATLAAKDEPALRANLRTLHMRSIVKVAGALRGKVPGTGVLKMPSLGIRSELLVRAAEAMKTTATPYKDVFVASGLPADFLDQLSSAAEALKASVDARGIALSSRMGASKSLGDDRSLGRQIVAMIDAALTHTLQSEPSTLASWRQAKRVTVKGVSSPRPSTTTPTAVSGGSTTVGGVQAATAVSETVTAGNGKVTGDAAVATKDGPVVDGVGSPVNGAGSVAGSAGSPSNGADGAAHMSEIGAAQSGQVSLQ